MAKTVNRRQLLVLAAVILPGLFISAWGVVSISQQRKARELKLKEEYSQNLELTRDEMEMIIETALTQVFREMGDRRIDPANQTAIQETLKEVLLKNQVVKFPFLIDSRGNYVFPLSGKPAPVEDGDYREDPLGQVVGNHYSKGEALELRERDFYGALGYYLQALKANRGRPAAPDIMNALARCYYKLKKYPQAISYLRDIELFFPERLRKDLPFHLKVLYQAAQAHRHMDKREAAFRAYLSLYERILRLEATGAQSPFPFFKNEALDFLNRHVKEMTAAGVIPRTGTLDRLERLSRVDISLDWQYIELEGGPGVQGGDSAQESAGFRFKKTQEFYLADNEKIRFYQAVKKLPYWKEAGVDGFQVRYFGRPLLESEETLTFQSLPLQGRGGGPYFFGFIISGDFVRSRILPAVKGRFIMDDEVKLSLERRGMDEQSQQDGVFHVSLPLLKFLPGWELELSFPHPGFIEGIVRKDIWSNYILVSALILALLFGIALFYKYISREAELVRIKSAFVDSASHTLKTPLTRIRILAEKMALGWIKEEEKKEGYLHTIMAETDQMAEMINNMLDFSKIESGKKQYEMVTSSLSACLEDILERNATYYRARGYNLEIDIAADIPDFSFDPAALRQVVLNILQNAVKYSGKGKWVGIRGDCDGERAVIAVSDRGLGIEGVEQGKIFDKFYRVSDDRVKAAEGSGLGLYLARHAVTAHGGDIRVESILGSGTTFFISLPISRKK